MKRRASLMLIVLLWALGLNVLLDAATITWSNIHPEGPALARDCSGDPLPGTATPGPTPDLSVGALVQLRKAVGEIDNPYHHIVEAHQDTDWRIDDILLDESHVGFGVSGNVEANDLTRKSRPEKTLSIFRTTVSAPDSDWPNARQRGGRW